EILAEVEDHLLEATEVFERNGRDPLAAELQALAQFGTPSLVSQALITEARKGAAVPTTFTRRAGIAAILVPIFAIVGQTINITIKRGFVHGIGVTLLALIVPLLGVTVVGLFRRHRGALHGWGVAAAVLFLASPFLAVPAGWGAGYVFVVILMIASAVLAIGMLRAHVLPRLPIILFGFAGSVGLIAVIVAEAAGADNGAPILWGVEPIEIGIATTTIGLAWLGWTMAREHALDMPPTARPLAVT
ncbi:MAG: hypothetical protein MUP97_07235, partial [Acidimicrobiia bacterium]|nr:hypothetical protein [Acidimicrobiia bacterium]